MTGRGGRPPDRHRLLRALRLGLEMEQAHGLDALPVPRRTAGPEDAAPGPGGPLAELARTVAACTRCGLSSSRTQAVFGEGSLTPGLMFVGEGPGADEDRTGRPFVGAAGRLLDRIIQAMGLRREDVYIANVVKCRPPGNRAPGPGETRTCLPFLREQIRLLRPRVICALGTPAATSLLDTREGITRLRGRRFQLPWDPRTVVMPTFHPAYLLRYPAEKRKAWSDVQKIMAELRLDAPNRPS